MVTFAEVGKTFVCGEDKEELCFDLRSASITYAGGGVKRQGGRGGCLGQVLTGSP